MINNSLENLISKIRPIDFKAIAIQFGELELSQKHLPIVLSEELIEVARQNGWNLIYNLEKTYFFNGAFWTSIEENEVRQLLTNASIKMGVKELDAKLVSFQNTLYTQFTYTANLNRKLNQIDPDNILINLANGTFVFKPRQRYLKSFDNKDFMTYQLDFGYDSAADTPLFNKYLNEVLPDKTAQDVLAEYCGYIFTKNQNMKLEKALLLYGGGANGKSVMFEIIMALLGRENVTNYSLQNLTDASGYRRAMIGNKLLNYSSEINGKMATDVFKQLVSGEPVEARLPYGQPQILHEYARLMFNCNELPKDIENTHAFTRRLLILNFDVTIPEEKQDKDLARKIIDNELPGVFNWILEGLERLMEKKEFTYCQSADEFLKRFRKESDTVQMFLDEGRYIESKNGRFTYLKDLYLNYTNYCKEARERPLTRTKFSARLRAMGFEEGRRKNGCFYYIEVDRERPLEELYKRELGNQNSKMVA